MCILQEYKGTLYFSIKKKLSGHPFELVHWHASSYEKCSFK